MSLMKLKNVEIKKQFKQFIILVEMDKFEKKN